ncbi:MAG: hypothetical protein Q8L85_07610 [Alphaproteobacteria bacterium]|nr:hypothetical protein [Alphaproteobacteria bacterium]
MTKIKSFLSLTIILSSFINASFAMRHVLIDGKPFSDRTIEMEAEIQKDFPYVLPGIATFKEGIVQNIMYHSFIAIQPNVLLTCAHEINENVKNKAKSKRLKTSGFQTELFIKGKKYTAHWVIHPSYVNPPNSLIKDIGFTEDIESNRTLLESEIGATAQPQYDTALVFLNEAIEGLDVFANLSASEPVPAIEAEAKLIACGFMATNNKIQSNDVSTLEHKDEKFMALNNLLLTNSLQENKPLDAFKFMKRQTGNIKISFDEQKSAFASIQPYPKGHSETLFLYPSDYTEIIDPVAVVQGDSGGALLLNENERFVVKGVNSSHTHVSLQQMPDNQYAMLFGADYQIPNKTYFAPIAMSKNWIDEKLRKRGTSIEWAQ